MHAKLRELVVALEQLRAQTDATLPNNNPLYQLTQNAAFGGLDREDLTREITQTIIVAKSLPDEDYKDESAWIENYKNRIDYVKLNMIPHINSNPQMITAVLNTIWSTKEYLSGLSEAGENPLVSVRKAAARVRSLEASLKQLEPKAKDLSQAVQDIRAAHQAAEQLPTDLEQLAEAQRTVSSLREKAVSEQSEIGGILNDALYLRDIIKERGNEAEALMARLDSAYRAATSQGLASAFEKKAERLNRSIWFWVAGLAIALVIGAWAGSSRVAAIIEALRAGEGREAVISLNVFLAVLSVGPAVWFAWLATKQTGQRFRLAEDYAFKAAVASAYEGFRREAVRVSPELEAELLRSALTRLDEQPLRFVEAPSPGSPMHEVLSSSSVREAFKVVPDFAAQLQQLAQQALSRVRPQRAVERPETTPGPSATS